MGHEATRATDGLIEDRARAGAAIDAAEARPTGARAELALAAAIDMLKGSTAASKRVFLVTDAQARTFEGTAGSFQQMLTGVDSSIGFVVLTVPDAPVSNLAVTGLEVATRCLRVGAPIRFDVRISDPGEPPAAQANVELWIDGRKVDRQQVVLAERRGVARFHHAFSSAGLVPVEVRLDPDAVDLDNRRCAMLCIPSSIDVLVVTGDEPADGKESPHVYLEAALSADDPGGDVWAPDFAVRPAVTRGQLAAALDGDVRVVILADPGSVPADGVRSLAEFVRRGGALFVIAGSDAVATFGSLRSAREETGLWFGDLAATPPSEPPRADQFWQLEPGSAATAGRREDVPGPPPINLESAGVRQAISAVHVFQAVTVGTGRQGNWPVLLRLTDGRPALLARDLPGEAGTSTPRASGRIVVFASSLEPTWCDLVYRPAIVPLLQDLLTWLCWPRLVSSTLEPGQAWNPIIPGRPEDWSVQMPEGESLPVMGFVTDDNERQQVRLDFDRTGAPGVYRLVSVQPGAPDALHAVAVNVDTAESDQTVLSADRIRALFPDGRIEVVASDTAIDEALVAGRSGREVWAMLAILLAVLLLAETLLAHRFSFQTSSPDAPSAASRTFSSEGRSA
jgi:hypothetical protein